MLMVLDLLLEHIFGRVAGALLYCGLHILVGHHIILNYYARALIGKGMKSKLENQSRRDWKFRGISFYKLLRFEVLA